MKKLIILLFIAAMIVPAMAQKNPLYKGSESTESFIELPKPTIKGGMPLYDALYNRHTTRTFSDKELTLQQVSDLLWCANGVNREDGKRTAPSARNAQEIEIYVFSSGGIFLYIPEKNILERISKEDRREEMSGQSKMIMEAPITLLFFANYEKMDKFSEESREFYGATDAGFVSQNVYLYCAANKMSTVVMGAIERDPIRDMIGRDGKAILAQPVGFVK